MTGIWIQGPTRSGRTTRLVQWFEEWTNTQASVSDERQAPPGVLVLSAVSGNRAALQDHLTLVSQAKFPFRHTTPLGFLEDEVKLFWALLVEQLDLKAQFPLRLRPETELELAQRLWAPELAKIEGWSEPSMARFVRQILDLMQLITLSHQPIKYLPELLLQAVGETNPELPLPYDTIADMLLQWRQWCLDRSLLTYSLIVDLYGQYLLADPTYLNLLNQRFQVILADNVDEYPAITRSLFETFLDRDGQGVFTFNSAGAVRLGLGADPIYMSDLSHECDIVTLEPLAERSLAHDLNQPVLELVNNPMHLSSLPQTIQTIQTTSRAQLIRQTAEMIIAAIRAGRIKPEEIAIIGPGLDPISRYAFNQILSQKGIKIALLNDQRPLSSSAITRSILTLMALVYPHLGRLVNRDSVAEMLVILSHETIDPVRAGLIADNCFEPDVEHPKLLAANTFSRWDRLGFEVTESYAQLSQWIEQARSRENTTPIIVIDEAIQQFFLAQTQGTRPNQQLNFEQLCVLRELMETAQHYWELNARLDKLDNRHVNPSQTVQQFIQLLRNGTVTANPLPFKTISPPAAVTLATVFQYRSSRRHHRWQFWFDAGASRWLNGIDSLFGAPFFLQSYSGQPWTVDDQADMNQARLDRILQDLLGRTTERVFLCYSDLATNGQEQNGALLSLVNAAVPHSLATTSESSLN
ncbi:recombinase family protein [filamentous cyanobacterium LEGE 11480]|uniref:Recombinase family protein n=1 Tax=Romeriopsis navalis LEGE 11480 TaxID=2777977 RepID=A0A928VLU3_9CYAN|nr:recombinase family protein [Romeriopsis navalis]MBE9028379.1 recombinase family protein [Romeriopsis navalis LEGE 11480]